MATHLQLSDSQLNDLQVIRDLKDGSIRAVVEHLTKMDSVLLEPTELFTAVNSQLPGTQSDSECLMRQALSLNGLMRRTGMNVDAVLAGVRSGIERDSGWTPDEIKKWSKIQPTFRNLICTNAFRLVATAVDLSYEYANLFRNGRILTDIRPLFTQDGNGIEGAVVSYTLRLRFDNTDGEHELSIAMDESDIRSLSKQCERSLKKARTARNMMRVKAGIPTVVVGEQADD